MQDIVWQGTQSRLHSPMPTSAAHRADFPQLDQAVCAARDQEPVQAVYRQGLAAQPVHVLHAVHHSACTQCFVGLETGVVCEGTGVCADHP